MSSLSEECSDEEPVPSNGYIEVNVPFHFDYRKAPKKFIGLLLKFSMIVSRDSQLGAKDIPSDFTSDDLDIPWHEQFSPEIFEQYVDGHPDFIRMKLFQPNLTRKEMLDA